MTHRRVADRWRPPGMGACYRAACSCGWISTSPPDRDGWPPNHDEDYARHLEDYRPVRDLAESLEQMRQGDGVVIACPECAASLADPGHKPGCGWTVDERRTVTTLTPVAREMSHALDSATTGQKRGQW